MRLEWLAVIAYGGHSTWSSYHWLILAAAQKRLDVATRRLHAHVANGGVSKDKWV